MPVLDRCDTDPARTDGPCSFLLAVVATCALVAVLTAIRVARAVHGGHAGGSGRGIAQLASDHGGALVQDHGDASGRR
jgi:hypothetical protein